MNRKLIAAAVQTAKKADVVVMVLGGNEQTSREAWAETHLGDRSSLDLVGQQEDLAKAIFALHKPTVVILLNGRPLSVNYLAENAPALLEGWYLGQETGHAVADVLFGRVNPGGKLPVTIPRSVGQLPVFYNHKPTARRGYLFDTTQPLYPFGFGLSYTTLRHFGAARADAGNRRKPAGARRGRRREHRQPRGRRGRPAVHPRRRGIGHPAGDRAQALPARHASAGRAADVTFELTPDDLALVESRHEEGRRARHLHHLRGAEFGRSQERQADRHQLSFRCAALVPRAGMGSTLFVSVRKAGGRRVRSERPARLPTPSPRHPMPPRAPPFAPASASRCR